MAEYWLSVGSSHTEADWKAFAQAHRADQPCGRDATAALEDVLARIERWYRAQSAERQSKLCCTAFDYWEGGPNTKASKAWDIDDLYDLSKKGSFREPTRSVRISGQCYDSAAVNYVMYGLMGKLCDKSFDNVWSRVAKWKKWRYGHVPDRETAAWARAGYDGWTPKKKVYSFTPYQVAGKKRGAYDKSDFSFTWLPYIELGTDPPRGR